jgi:hypothetical protein
MNTTTTVRRKEKDRRDAAQFVQILVGGSGSFYGVLNGVSAGTNVGDLTVNGTAGNTSSMTFATFANVSSGNDDYFKPYFAEHLRRMIEAPLDATAPEGEQEFIDWLNRD